MLFEWTVAAVAGAVAASRQGSFNNSKSSSNNNNNSTNIYEIDEHHLYLVTNRFLILALSSLPFSFLYSLLFCECLCVLVRLCNAKLLFVFLVDHFILTSCLNEHTSFKKSNKWNHSGGSNSVQCDYRKRKSRYVQTHAHVHTAKDAAPKHISHL